MPISGAALEEIDSTQVVAAWIAAPKTVSARVTGEWESLGNYYLPSSAEDIALEVIHMVSASGLTSEVRILDVEASEIMTGATSTTATVPTRTQGARFNITGGKVYQLQARCVGASGAAKFSLIASATITD